MLRGQPFYTKPWFILLLPVFFVFHGYMQHYPVLSGPDALKLLLVYLLVVLILTGISFFIFRQWTKAFLFSFILMSIQFFFGNFHDTLKQLFPGSFIQKYSFVLPMVLLTIAGVGIIVYRSRRSFHKSFRYLNILFLVLIAADIIFLTFKIPAVPGDKEDEAGIVNCATCTRPNIYLLILDEYAGHEALKELFSFDNAAFENELKARDFTVLTGTRSNYNFTPFSMASIFSMNYLPLKSNKSNDLQNRNTCLRLISKNSLINALRKFDYEFVNLSMFDFAGEPNEVDGNEFYSTRTKLVTSQTLTGRLKKDLWFHTVLSYKWNWAIKDYQDGLEEQMQEQFARTASAGVTGSKPRFVYTHFIMPHYPYLYDEYGKSLTIEKVLNGGKDEYLGFLKYANRFTINLVDSILKNDKTDPMIIIMSDHGFTKYGPPTIDNYYFQNIVNLRMPSNNPARLPDSISNVNIFRSILNIQFGQKMPLLKDSTILLKEY